MQTYPEVIKGREYDVSKKDSGKMMINEPFRKEVFLSFLLKRNTILLLVDLLTTMRSSV